LGWEQRLDHDNVTGTGKQWVYHTKSDELKRTSPGGLVPTLIPVDPDTGKPDEARSVYESIVTIEYIDNVSGAKGRDRLVSDDPFWAARARVWADKVNRECCSTYYGVLVRKDEAERREHFENLIRGLEVRLIATHLNGLVVCLYACLVPFCAATRVLTSLSMCSTTCPAIEFLYSTGGHVRTNLPAGGTAFHC
jgi:hypothetical protein